MTEGDDREGGRGNEVLRHSANTVTDDGSRWEEGRRGGGGKIDAGRNRGNQVVISEDLDWNV